MRFIRVIHLPDLLCYEAKLRGSICFLLRRKLVDPLTSNLGSFLWKPKYNIEFQVPESPESLHSSKYLEWHRAMLVNLSDQSIPPEGKSCSWTLGALCILTAWGSKLVPRTPKKHHRTSLLFLPSHMCFAIYIMAEWWNQCLVQTWHCCWLVIGTWVSYYALNLSFLPCEMGLTRGLALCGN